ncbi:1-aminocyclopropane-1-carboxylate deaminase/D-cysteine desulfhydrase [Aliikangiella sp. IMCC44359]|uniref:1-aminocyclopropane-1-carboxylate deaminase/D-cysteine desulfhydrase n=1 Tax=Aliikangiella sp. IMCC44359 TaxID=3459125 RepID=UPI00403B16FF
MRLSRVSHFFSELNTSFIQPIPLSIAQEKCVYLDVKRDDLLHPIVSGNKWRKLKHLLLHIESLGVNKIAVMGGPYSNLVHALAYIAYRLDWSIQLFIRGYSEQALTPTLIDASRWGAEIIYVNRIEYRQMRNKPPTLENNIFWIEEGGFHHLALKGTAEIFMEISSPYDYVVMATATGATLAGLSVGVKKKKSDTKIIGISILNNAAQVSMDISNLLKAGEQLPQIISGYEFGGYAKKTAALIDFIQHFSSDYNIELEPIYSGKAFYAVNDLITHDYFPRGSKVLLIHCGGLQGNRIIN